MRIKEQLPLKEEKKATSKIAIVENSEPCCMPGCCGDSSNGK
jgi:hypothetical protein